MLGIKIYKKLVHKICIINQEREPTKKLYNVRHATNLQKIEIRIYMGHN